VLFDIRRKIGRPVTPRLVSTILVVQTLGLFGLGAWFRTDRGRLFRDTLLLRLPILGKVFTKAAMARFASIFAILQASGVTVLESMEIISGTIGNAAISAQFDTLKEKLEQGRGLAEPLRSARYFTPMLITMIAIGEESGQLEDMLRRYKASDPDLPVVIKGDEQIYYKKIIEILDLLQRLEISQMGLVTQKLVK
jgi:type II secretory pathway component PulF